MVHHFQVAVESVNVDETHFYVQIQNRMTGASLMMVVPIEGMHSEPLTREMALQIGETVTDALRQAPYLSESSYERRGGETGGEMSAE